MSLKDNFTADEWFKVMTGPGRAGAAVVAASPSGVTGLLAEAGAIASAMRESVSQESRTPLMEAMAADLLGQPAARPPEQERARNVEDVKNQSLEGVRQAMWLVSAKASPEDAAAYRNMIMLVAQRTAEAAKEGGFLGIGGTQVNDKEHAVIEELRQLVGGAETGRGLITHETPPGAATVRPEPGPDGSGNSN
ncbi:hypothetical protein GCM10010840_01390 [Deinococcus aerolatus]|uniref:Uncharacterized protein n=1 Tax=Deinococcus aerolatus TaxID=522487 RepID=A0ABQ2FZ72_9DEIO|nr:hypothetical protein [Deinococcus aerolatus]GGL67165.1 hypothetical protein GCM10010840_01390 [Deinococcus aerolatus]